MARHRDEPDGRWFRVRRGDRLACCDCGLVHDVTIRRGPAGYELRLTRNARATAAARRGHRKERS